MNAIPAYVDASATHMELTVGDLLLDGATLEVHGLRGERVELAPIEWRLLVHLAMSDGARATKAELREKLWIGRDGRRRSGGSVECIHHAVYRLRASLMKVNSRVRVECSRGTYSLTEVVP
jgi:DNA-binding response OmpR family regulator